MDQIQERIQEDELEEAPPEETPPETPPEVTQEALDTGWLPEDQFKGDKKKWRPAEEWVERGRTLIPIIKTQLRTTESELANLKREFERQKKTSEKLVQMSEKVGQEAYERAKRELTQQQVTAVSEGDVEKWQKLEDEKDKLTKPEPVAPEPEQFNPAFNDWHKNNDWYLNDEDLTTFANAHAQQINPEGKMDATTLYENVEKKVKELFPHKFSNPARDNLSPVDSPSQLGNDRPSDKKTYADLPADAKAMCNSFVKQGLIKSREAYVKSYYEEE